MRWSKSDKIKMDKGAAASNRYTTHVTQMHTYTFNAGPLLKSEPGFEFKQPDSRGLPYTKLSLYQTLSIQKSQSTKYYCHLGKRVRWYPILPFFPPKLNLFPTGYINHDDTY